MNLHDHYVIETTRELVNPTKDSRNKRDWNKLPTIPAGSRFIVHVMSLAWMIAGTATRDADETPSREDFSQRYAFELISSELAKLILANAKCVEPESVKEFSDDGEEILRILIKLGRVKPEDFAKVVSAVEAAESF